MKGLTKLFLLMAVAFAVIAVGLSTEIPSYLKYKNGDITDYSELKAGELTGDELVTGVIDDCDGSIAELEETNTILGIPTSKRVTSQYYAVYTFNNEYFIYETADEEECAVLDKLTEETQEFYEAVKAAYDAAEEGEEADLSDVERPATTLTFTGRITGMRDDVRDIFKEWYGEDFDTDCEAVYEIRKCDFSGFRWTVPAMIGSAVLAVVMLILAVISFIRRRRARRFSY